MKSYILLVLIIHTTTATIDLETLKETAATKLQKIQENAAIKLQTIQDKAAESLQQFTDSIDFEKVKKLDILNILPKLQYKGKVIQDTVKILPEYKQKVKFYLQSIKSLSGQDLVLAFDAGVPWPAKRIDEEYVIGI